MAGYYYIGMLEQEIIEGCKRKERKFQEALFQKYHRKIYGICRRYASDSNEAEDLMQEALIHILKKIDHYRQTGSFESWMWSVTVRIAIQIKRKKNMLVFVEDYTSTDEPAYDSYALEKISAEELRKVINMLPEGYKMVFNLFAIEGYTHSEISELLGISVGTSKSQYSRAKVFLFRLLEKELDIKLVHNHAGI